MDNPEAFKSLLTLAKAVMAFAFMIFCLSIIFALATQAVIELTRRPINRAFVRIWFRGRKHSLSIENLMDEMGYISEKALFAMPYWQMTGQLSAALSAKLNINPYSKLVFALADVDEKFKLDDTGIKNDDVPVASTKIKEEDNEVLRIRAIAARAQNGIHALHSILRSSWNVFDYNFSLFFVYLWMGIFYILPDLTDAPQRGDDGIIYALFLFVAGLFTWLATPIVRRTIENYVPFR